MVNQSIFQNISSTLLGLPLKQFNLTVQNFPKVDEPKMVFEENFLILIVTKCLQKNEYLKNVNFLILSISQ